MRVYLCDAFLKILPSFLYSGVSFTNEFEPNGGLIFIQITKFDLVLCIQTMHRPSGFLLCIPLIARDDRWETLNECESLMMLINQQDTNAFLSVGYMTFSLLTNPKGTLTLFFLGAQRTSKKVVELASSVYLFTNLYTP